MTRAIVIVFALGCGSEPAPRVPSNSSTEPAPTTASTTCYLRSGFTPPDENPVVLVRTLDPAAQTISERYSGYIAEYGRMFHMQRFAVTGNRFSDPNDVDTHTEGTLDGPAWRWTGWTTKQRLGEVMTMERWTTVIGASLTEHAVVHYPRGSDRVIPPYRYDPVDCAPYLKPHGPPVIDI